MRKVVIFFLIIFNLALLYVAYQLLTPLISSGNAALIIDTSDVHAVVTLNGKVVGSTPYKTDKLRAGQYSVKLTADIEAPATGSASPSAKPKVYKASWENTIKLNTGIWTTINRSFGPGDIFSAGEVLTLEKGSGVSIITNPEESEISIDNKSIGKSPVSTEAQGTHVIKISKDGYFGRELTVNIPADYRLTISANLAVNPLSPLTEKDRSGDIRLLDLSTANSRLLSNPSNWADGVFYYSAKLASPSASLDLLLDYKGATYSAVPKGWETNIKATKKGTIGYLGKKDESLTDEAKKVFSDLVSFLTGSSSTASSTGQVQITDTPTGFLNVRAAASLSAAIITKVNPGDKLDLLEEKPSWYHIKLPDGKDGWISAQYAKKL